MDLALTIILILTSILMIILVLLHKGKGSGLSDLLVAEFHQIMVAHLLLRRTWIGSRLLWAVSGYQQLLL